MKYIGLDIGGTKCAITTGEGNQKPKILSREEFLTCGLTCSEILQKFCDKMQRIFDKTEIGGIGISCGGPLDSEKGVILSPPNLPGWDNVEIVRYFENRFSVPVKLENDANACAVAEWKYGAGKGTKNAVFFTFGTGLGAGLILGGKLYRGSCGNAGEAGHIRLARTGPVGYGKIGSFEGYCSGRGIAALGKKMVERSVKNGTNPPIVQACGGIENITAKTLADWARKGDSLAQKVYRISGEKLGMGLSVVIDILNPQVIILGGVFMRSHDLLEPHMMRVLKRECLVQSLSVCRILPAELGENIGDYAALTLAQEACRMTKIC